MPKPLEFQFEPDEKIYSVSELNLLVRDILEINFSNIWMEGEISNYKLYPSGHHYFTLKDDKSEIRAVLFAGAAMGLPFKPEDGMQVLANGKITVYPERGQYQIIVESLKPAGEGKLRLEFERLKEKLRAEGLFDSSHKKPLPQFPETIGIVTSSSGAAIRDMLSILARRYPLAKVYLFPVKVQGEGAAAEIAAAIQSANRLHNEFEQIDTLIIGRGGGSLEDLWAFNEEVVARAVFESQVPVISAVGHEVDFSIADFVSDLRAPTPSAAIEQLVPDRRDLISHCLESVRRMRDETLDKIANLQMRVNLQTSSYAFRRPVQRIQQALQRLDHLSESMFRAQQRKAASMRERFSILLSKLEGVSPVAVMKRGYAVPEDSQGNVIKSIDQVNVQDKIDVKLREGMLKCEVIEKIKSWNAQ